jgi:type I restriction enzyme S subunit
MPEAGDVVITTEAPLGEVAQLPKGKVALAQRVITLRGKKGVVDNTFLKFLLLSRQFQKDLQARATGTTVIGIKQSVLRKIDLAFPPFQEQKAIAHILGTLDDKIELNRKTNETLEAMAKALFKSWFVDFDPVRAKAEGRTTGLPAEISDLFPDSFEDSELGEIPSGWKCSPLADRAIYLSRGISPAYCEEGGVLVLNQKCVRDSRVSFEKARRHDTTRKQVIEQRPMEWCNSGGAAPA